MPRTLILAALVTTLASPALAGDYPWSYHSGGRHSTSRSHYRSVVPPGIVGGRSVPSHGYGHSSPYRHRDYRSGSGRDGDTIIIIERDGRRGRRW